MTPTDNPQAYRLACWAIDPQHIPTTALPYDHRAHWAAIVERGTSGHVVAWRDRGDGQLAPVLAETGRMVPVGHLAAFATDLGEAGRQLVGITTRHAVEARA